MLKKSLNYAITYIHTPSRGDQQGEDELNRFLRSHRILQVERHFCSENGGYWALLVEYVDGDPTAEVPPVQRREKKDFSEGLTEEEKVRFESYKVVRRELAQQNNIPAYLVFTNEELAILSRLGDLGDERYMQSIRTSLSLCSSLRVVCQD